MVIRDQKQNEAAKIHPSELSFLPRRLPSFLPTNRSLHVSRCCAATHTRFLSNPGSARLMRFSSSPISAIASTGSLLESFTIRRVPILKECVLGKNQSQQLIESQRNIPSDPTSLIRLLRTCSDLKALVEGYNIHNHITLLGMEKDVFIANYLITMYGNCCSLQDALHAFLVIHPRNVVSWTSIIAVHTRQDECLEALFLFKKMQLDCIKPNKVTFSSAIAACANLEAVVEGMLTHAYLAECGFESDIVVNNALINMYTKCGVAADAQSVFDKMTIRDVVTWTAMIVANVQNGHGTEAFEVFQGMLNSGIMPNAISFISILSACTSIKGLAEGNVVHAFIVEYGFDSQHAVTNAILNLYGVCGCLEDVKNTFRRITYPNGSNWTTLIALFVQHGCSSKAFDQFDLVLEKGVEFNKITFLTILSACTDHEFLPKGRDIHAFIVNVGYDADVEVGNALLSMYSRCGSLENAEKIFHQMSSRDIITWTSIIVALTDHRLYDDAFELFQSMTKQGMKPDNITFVSILSACTEVAALQLGQNIHTKIVETGLDPDIVMGNSLLTMYGKCGSVVDAQLTFDSMREKNIISWNAMISFLLNSGILDMAFNLFQKMVFNGIKPDKISFLGILPIFVSEYDLCQGRLTHVLIVESSLGIDMEVANALVAMYGKCGSLMDAKGVFEKLEQPDVITWTSVIAAHAQVGNNSEVVNLFYKMQSKAVKPDKYTLSLVVAACSTPDMLLDGENIHVSMLHNIESDIILENALVNMYGKCGSLVKAEKMFKEMYQHDLFSFNALISAHAQHLHGKDAFNLLQQMQLEDIVPDKVSYLGVLSACSGIADLKVGKIIHALIGNGCLELDEVVGNALVNMYSKCGSIGNAWGAFNSLPKQDVVSWTTMVAAYAHHGYINRALEVFELMESEGIEPNEVSFVSILSACSRAGSIDEALTFFKRMSWAKRILLKPSHYGCMADLFTRAGRLEEAEDFLRKWPSQPGVVDWMTLLSASKICGDVERGKLAAEHLLELDHECTAAYVVLANVYVKYLDREEDVFYFHNNIHQVQHCSILFDYTLL